MFSKSSTYIVCNTVQTQGWRTENLFLRERERGKEEKERGGRKRDAKEESVGRKRKREGEGRQKLMIEKNSKEGEGRRENGRKTIFTT